MKLATLREGTRDGTLLVVSNHLKRAAKADQVAPTLRAASGPDGGSIFGAIHQEIVKAK